MMRRLLFVLPALVVLSGCGGTEAERQPSEDVPDYEVASSDDRGSELVIPGVDADGAEAAIRAYADEHQAGWEGEHSITVLRSADATTYACMGRWIEDEQASQVYTGGDVTSDEWPTIEINCPNPDAVQQAEGAVSPREVVEAFEDAGLPVSNPRDTSDGCTTPEVCTARMTTDEISVYGYDTEEAAAHYAVTGGEDYHQAGTIVLNYATARTPAELRPDYERVLGELVGAG